MTKDQINQILTAKITESPDKSQIKWRQRKYVIEIRGKKLKLKLKNHRPPAKIYWNILRESGKNLCVCECCGNDDHITIHHLDGNPNNNQIENLQVLCWDCHQIKHFPDEQGIINELQGTISESNYEREGDRSIRELDDLLGIIHEE